MRVGRQTTGGAAESCWEGLLRAPRLAVQGWLRRAVDAEAPQRAVRLRRQLLFQARALASAGTEAGGTLPALIELGEDQGEPWLLTARVPGRPLCERSEAYGRADAVTLWVGVALAVSALHRAGWVHCDLNPTHVFLHPEAMQLRLAHLSRVAPVGLSHPLGRLAHSPDVGPYAAPELAQGLPLTPSADVYGLGALLYRLLVGEDPVPGRRGERAVPLVPSLDPDVRALVLRAMHPDPVRRHPGVEPLLEELVRLAGWTRARSGSTPPAPDDAVGRELDGGRYRILGVLARGGEGVVYRAERRFEREDLPPAPVLIKAIRYDTADDSVLGEAIAAARRQLEHEARSAQRLGRYTGAVPQVIDFFTDRAGDERLLRRAPWATHDEPYLVLEHVGAPTLRSWSKRPDDWILRAAGHMARALRLVHQRRFLYQDLKPDNVLVDELGAVLHLVDFGSVCPLLDDGTLDERSPGFAHMTPGYQGPEFARLWERTDARFDLYGLGATLFWAWTDTCPLRDLAAPAMEAIPLELAGPARDAAQEAAETPPLDLRSLRGTAAHWQVLLRPFTERDPQRRVRDATAGLRLLAAAARRLQGGPLPPAIVRRLVQPRGPEDGFGIEALVPHDAAVTGIVLERERRGRSLEVDRAAAPGGGEVTLSDPRPGGGSQTYRLRTVGRHGGAEGQRVLRAEVAPVPQLRAHGERGRVRIRWSALGPADEVQLRRLAPDEQALGPEAGAAVPVPAPGSARVALDLEAPPRVARSWALFVRYGSTWARPARADATALPPPQPPQIEPAPWSEPQRCGRLRWSPGAEAPDAWRLEWPQDPHRGARLIEAPFRCSAGHAVAVGSPGCADCGGPLVMDLDLELDPGEIGLIHLITIHDGIEAPPVEALRVGWAHPREIRGRGRVGRASLSWSPDPGVTYALRRLDGDLEHELQPTAPGRWEGPLPEGRWQLALRAIVDLAGEPQPMGEERVTVAVLRLPRPDLSWTLRDRELELRWAWPDDHPTRRLDRLELAVLTRDAEVAAEAVPVDGEPLWRVDGLPDGANLRLRARPALAEDRGEIEEHSLGRATAPARDLRARPSLAGAELSWSLSAAAMGARVLRVTADERVELDAGPAPWLDQQAPRGVALRYEVEALYGDAAARPVRSDELTVPTLPPPPRQLQVAFDGPDLVVSWDADPEDRSTTGWLLVVDDGRRSEREIDVDRRDLHLPDVRAWFPVEVELRSRVGDEVAPGGARTSASRTPPLDLSFAVGLHGASWRWTPPGPGLLEVERSCAEGFDDAFDADLQDGSLSDLPDELGLRYSYRARAVVEHPGRPRLVGPWQGPFVAEPRKEPPRLEAPRLRLQPDGRQVTLRWPPGPTDGCEVLHVLSDHEVFSAGDLLGIAELRRRLEGQPGVQARPAEPPFARLPRLGVRYHLFRVAMAEVGARVSAISSVWALPRVEGARLRRRGPRVELELPAGSGPLLALRRGTGEGLESPIMELLAPDVGVEGGDHSPRRVRAPNLLRTLDAVRSSLPRDAEAHLVEPQAGPLVIEEPDEGGPWRWSLHALVRHDDESWLLSSGKTLADPQADAPWLRYTMRRQQASSGEHVELRWAVHGELPPGTLRWTFDGPASQVAPPGATSLRLWDAPAGELPSARAWVYDDEIVAIPEEG